MEKIEIKSEIVFENLVRSLKAMADKNRLKIIDILSCGEICACDILEGLNISQSTLSHHMKKLVQCNLVNARIEGSWTHYSLNLETFNLTMDSLIEVFNEKEDCSCTILKKGQKL